MGDIEIKVQQILDICLENRLQQQQKRLQLGGQSEQDEQLEHSSSEFETDQQVAPTSTAPAAVKRPTHLSLLKPILVLDRGQQTPKELTPVDDINSSSDSPVVKKRVTLVQKEQQ